MMASRNARLCSHLRAHRAESSQPKIFMTSTIGMVSFTFRTVRPFSQAEFKFKTALGQYASERLLPRLKKRAGRNGGMNHYTGINARISDAIYLEAIMTNQTEWGGFGFDFARLVPANSGLYNLSIRRLEDWTRAERETVAAASEYFISTAICPRASDWIQIARGKTFEECVDVLSEMEDGRWKIEERRWRTADSPSRRRA
jgi:hypothetical protein